jgi:hypothetical protein
VKAIWQGRVTEAAVRYGEHAPMATVCCNACRACVQTNLIGLGLAVAGAAAARVARLVPAALHRSRAASTSRSRG